MGLSSAMSPAAAPPKPAGSTTPSFMRLDRTAKPSQRPLAIESLICPSQLFATFVGLQLPSVSTSLQTASAPNMRTSSSAVILESLDLPP